MPLNLRAILVTSRSAVERSSRGWCCCSCCCIAPTGCQCGPCVMPPAVATRADRALIRAPECHSSLTGGGVSRSSSGSTPGIMTPATAMARQRNSAGETAGRTGRDGNERGTPRLGVGVANRPGGCSSLCLGLRLPFPGAWRAGQHADIMMMIVADGRSQPLLLIALRVDELLKSTLHGEALESSHYPIESTPGSR